MVRVIKSSEIHVLSHDIYKQICVMPGERHYSTGDSLSYPKKGKQRDMHTVIYSSTHTLSAGVLVLGSYNN